jgi:hypothetical protein
MTPQEQNRINILAIVVSFLIVAFVIAFVDETGKIRRSEIAEPNEQPLPVHFTKEKE